MLRPARRPDTSDHPVEVHQLRDRIRLYLQVMLTVDVVAHLSDHVTPLLFEGLETPDYPAVTLAVRWGVTVLIAAAWAVTRFVQPGRTALVALETSVALGLALVYVHIATVHLDGEFTPFGPVFAMFGVMLLLGVRAALVPSPVPRTAAIGLASVACVFVFGGEAVRSLDPTILEGIVFIGGAYVLATAVTSHVIYGLRREVRAAQRLGQYTLEAKLGESGMGTVYRARHAMLRRDAAIKLIRPDGDTDPERRAQTQRRFEREAHVTARLQSPHTVELYDFGLSADGSYYYVMELLDGIDLHNAVTRYGPMPPPRVVHVLRQIYDSLEEAHVAGLVHRDVKPANVLLCHHGLRHDFVKVLDFGLVALEEEERVADPKLTIEGMVGGTPAYMAPEMATDPTAVDGRADLYAVGCIAYWLLSGRPPFERDTAMATILAHVNDAPPPLSHVSEVAVPADLGTLVLGCVAKEPSRRPASAGELSGRLAAIVEVGTWTETDASRWWSTHRPSTVVTPEEFEPLSVTRVAP